MFETWYKEIAMIQSGLNLRAIITDRLPIADYAQGFARMGEGNCGKVVLDWG
jgi:threonine 3-dehydrogenase